jgi:hypothetical protein
MTKEQLLERQKHLEEQRRKLEAEFNYMNGQIAGQLALITELLKEPDNKET